MKCMSIGSIVLLALYGLLAAATVPSAVSNNEQHIASLVTKLKKDPRGPFKAIKWFCPDGSTIAAAERCATAGGIQRAVHKDEVTALAKKNGLYLGQILAGTDPSAFLDRANNHSRLKQYLVEKYLIASDDGWILRKARYYRGAYQAEDEEAWGKQFLLTLLGDDTLVRSNFFLCREAVRGIPHRSDDRHLEKIRLLSKTIADTLPAFMDIRIKIHGQPDKRDIERVDAFRSRKDLAFTPAVTTMLDDLYKALAAAYADRTSETLAQFIRRLPKNSTIAPPLDNVIHHLSGLPPSSQCTALAMLLEQLRTEINATRKADYRLTLLDLSLDLELLLFKKTGDFTPGTLDALLLKNSLLARAAYGCGFIETQEWKIASGALIYSKKENSISFKDLTRIYEHHRRIVEWSSGMVRAFYQPVLKMYSGFEPLAAGFGDDRIHSSIVLPAGDAVGLLGDVYVAKAGIKNSVFGLKTQNQCRGLNPGYAKGTLVIITGEPENIDFTSNTIYLMQRPPSNLKPVAGIGTVTEGNVVSHVQLLARNLGVPNIVISQKLLTDLKPYNNSNVFFAVSPRGAVTLKPLFEIDEREKDLFTGRKELTSKVKIPADKIAIKNTALLSLHSLRAHHSGSICGPKAANLGQLSAAYPNNVAPGFIIPFGVFFEHMQQTIPGEEISYWKYLQQTFENIDTQNDLDEISSASIINRLSHLQSLIRKIPLSKPFIELLRRQFVKEFNKEAGNMAVFIRSDTNVEDLKDFSGAGLNLTVPNIVAEIELHQAIRDVWASPYSERSFRWRQRFLTNPMQVYPSILILKSVNCDKSGVMITTGISSGTRKNFTISFNRGVAGAVDGQYAEMYEIDPDGVMQLLAPAREPYFMTLPPTGGTRLMATNFDEIIVSPHNLDTIRKTGLDLRKRLPKVQGIDSEGPFDIELGFTGDSLWLFQVRPYVENRNAGSSRYLRSLDGPLPKDIAIALDQKL